MYVLLKSNNEALEITMMHIVKLTSLDIKKSDNVAMALTSNHLNEI